MAYHLQQKPNTEAEAPALMERPWFRRLLLCGCAAMVSLGLLGLAAAAISAKTPAAAGSADPTVPPEYPAALYTVPTGLEQPMLQRLAAVRDGFPMTELLPENFSVDERGRAAYTAEGVRTRTGVDVSEFQYGIDWGKVAKDGIDFAMIRVGYRGSTKGDIYADKYFEKNLNGALKAGLDVGVYFYSQAVTPEEAKEEAEYVLSKIKGYDITMPVVFDWEIVGGEDARTYTVHRQTLVECARIYCEAVKDAGYDPMIYFTHYLGYRKYILRELTDYGFWYAEYEPVPRFTFHCDIWQYSDTARVNGIDGDVDLDLQYIFDE